MTSDLREFMLESETNNEPQSQPAPDFGPNLSLDEVRQIYVGRGYKRFEAAFAKCDAAGKAEHTVSIAPFFFSFLWFFYRKMNLEGLIILAVCLVASVLADYILTAAPTAVMAGVGVAVALNAKGIYWRAVDKKIAQAMRLHPNSPTQAVEWLRARGGVAVWPVIAGVILFVLPFFYYHTV